ncbi:hypothetical protein NA57DRAFT_51817 [Rhizodiscina lignyota]|uniref:Zn(2)-C6 fungal-type domain-containing protein n=1 Tax=Rhizodiscina lignyota TaxID=1504668 RepID=A0A9P4IP26_9PEZI|nr:hypothetical protein NA57DRAFT_51817 [Rhizodiscina lignyota]
MKNAAGGAAARSHNGCLTCKLRKLKCDESRPSCGRCSLASRACEYSDSSIFRQFDIQKPTNRARLRESDDTDGTFGDDDVWVEVPRKLTFIQVIDPYEEEYETSLELAGRLPEIQDRQQVKASPQLAPPVKTTSNPNSSMDPTGPHTNSSSYTPISLPFGSAEASPWNAEPYPRPVPPSKPPDTSEVELVQLLRYFANVPGQWMDLFDTRAYYSRRVTILAARSALLKFAACSLAAKCLHRIRRNGSISVPESAGGASPEDFHRGHVNDWQYKSVEYYDHAIGLLREATQLDQQHLYGTSTGIKSDEVLAAIALLAMFELMDSPGPEWKAHLSALLLLDTPSTAVLSSPSMNEIPRSITNHSIFWNFARQDYLAAFIGETRTRLDSTDVHLWRRFGLNIDDEGLLLPFNSDHSDNLHADEPSDRGHMNSSFEEDAVCNALFWLLGKIVNFLAVGDGLQPGDFELPLGFRNRIGIAQESLLENWTALAVELATWYESLPPTFMPSVRKTSDPHPETQSIMPSQIWHAVPMCASAMQHYHMARIILLVNKPMESTAIRSSVTARLSSYRVIQQEVLRHSREIYAISMSDPADTVRIHSVQPLFVAGQCLTEPWERETVLDLLAGIQRELGWATDYRIKTLTEQWNAEYGGANRLLLPPTPG